MIIFGFSEMNSITNKLSFSSCCNKLNQTTIGWTLYSFRPLKKKIWNKLKRCPFRMIGIGHEFPVHWSIYYGNNDFHIDRIYIYQNGFIFDLFGCHMCLCIPSVIGSNANAVALDGNPESADASDFVSWCIAAFAIPYPIMPGVPPSAGCAPGRTKHPSIKYISQTIFLSDTHTKYYLCSNNMPSSFSFVYHTSLFEMFAS